MTSTFNPRRTTVVTRENESQKSVGAKEIEWKQTHGRTDTTDWVPFVLTRSESEDFASWQRCVKPWRRHDRRKNASELIFLNSERELLYGVIAVISVKSCPQHLNWNELSQFLNGSSGTPVWTAVLEYVHIHAAEYAACQVLLPIPTSNAFR